VPPPAEEPQALKIPANRMTPISTDKSRRARRTMVVHLPLPLETSATSPGASLYPSRVVARAERGYSGANVPARLPTWYVANLRLMYAFLHTPYVSSWSGVEWAHSFAGEPALLLGEPQRRRMRHGTSTIPAVGAWARAKLGRCVAQRCGEGRSSFDEG